MAAQHTFSAQAALPAIVLAEPGHVVRIASGGTEAVFAREGADLVFFSPVGTVTYNGYFGQGMGNPLPSLEFADGKQIAGETFLREAAPDMNLTPELFYVDEPEKRRVPRADACCARLVVSKNDNRTYYFRLLDAGGMPPPVPPDKKAIALVGETAAYFSLFGVDSGSNVIFTLAPEGVKALGEEADISGSFEAWIGRTAYVVRVSMAD